MDRRTFLANMIGTGICSKLPLCLFSEASTKKGCAGDWPRDQMMRLRPNWFYNWGRQTSQNIDIPFIPMAWGSVATTELGEVDRTSGVLLGFNEPDHGEQANMSVGEALALWPRLEATGLRLGSPVPAYSEGKWINEFMAGAHDKRVDFMTFHWYGLPIADDFLGALDSMYTRFGKPIWITEFACADWEAESQNRKPSYTVDDVSRFMAAVIPRLESLDYVEKYAWMSVDQDPSEDSSVLFNRNGTLTPLGVQYSRY